MQSRCSKSLALELTCNTCSTNICSYILLSIYPSHSLIISLPYLKFISGSPLSYRWSLNSLQWWLSPLPSISDPSRHCNLFSWQMQLLTVYWENHISSFRSLEDVMLFARNALSNLICLANSYFSYKSHFKCHHLLGTFPDWVRCSSHLYCECTYAFLVIQVL